jgi:hypothetical protein
LIDLITPRDLITLITLMILKAPRASSEIHETSFLSKQVEGFSIRVKHFSNHVNRFSNKMNFCIVIQLNIAQVVYPT